MKKKLSGERGGTLVEFSVAATLFFLIVFGGIHFTRAVWQYNIVANAAKAAVRWTAVRGGSVGQIAATDTQIHDYIVTQMYGFSEVDSVTWLPAGGDKGRGDTVQIVVRSSYTTSIPVIRNYTLPLRSSAKMIIAR
jgi:Flp pilus assembly protein TadG